MDFREAWSTILTLAADYAPKQMPWTDPAADEATNEATAKRWVELFEKYDDDVAQVAVAEFQRNSPGWPPTFVEMSMSLSAVKDRGQRQRPSLPSPDRPIAHNQGIRIALDAYKRAGGVGPFGHWAEDALERFEADGDEKVFLSYGAWLAERGTPIPKSNR